MLKKFLKQLFCEHTFFVSTSDVVYHALEGTKYISSRCSKCDKQSRVLIVI